MEAVGLRPTILRQLNETLKTPEERGGGGYSVVGIPVAQVVIQGGKFLKEAFQLLEYSWPRWSSKGGKFLKPCSSSEEKTFECLRNFVLRLQ